MNTKQRATTKSKKPTTSISFSATEDMKEQLTQIAQNRKQTKSTVIKTCIQEALYSDLHSENLLYYEIAKITNDKTTSDKTKLTETKKVIKKLMELRRHAYE